MWATFMSASPEIVGIVIVTSRFFKIPMAIPSTETEKGIDQAL